MGATIPPLSKPKESCQVNSYFYYPNFTMTLRILTLFLCIDYSVLIRNSHLKPNTVKHIKKKPNSNYRMFIKCQKKMLKCFLALYDCDTT